MPSSVILWMRYDPHARTLDIAFRDGRGVYRYFDVAVSEWQVFRSAPSKGTYLNQAFKAGGYGYEKLPRDAVVSLTSAAEREEFTWGEVPWRQR